MGPVTTVRSRIPVPIPRHNRTISAPSKLEMLREHFEAQLEREKAHKLRTMHPEFYGPMIPKRRLSGSGRSAKRNGMLRNFFNERKHLDETGKNDQLRSNITYHYQQQKRQFQHSGAESKPPLPQYQKNSAGRDKAHPLAPIDKTSSTGSRGRPAEDSSHGYYSPKPPAVEHKPKNIRNHRRYSLSSGYDTPQGSGNESDTYSPGPQKALIPIDQAPTSMRREVIKKTNKKQTTGSSDEEIHETQSGRNKDARLKRDNITRKPPTQPPSSGPRKKAPHVAKNKDFVKWQEEQNQDRDMRLQKYRQAQEAANHGNNMRDEASTPTARGQHAQVDKLEHVRRHAVLKAVTPRHASDTESETDAEEYEMREKEKRLNELIRQQQQQLQALRETRKKDASEKLLSAERHKRGTGNKEKTRRLRSVNSPSQRRYSLGSEAGSLGTERSTYGDSPTPASLGSHRGVPHPPTDRQTPTSSRRTLDSERSARPLKTKPARKARQISAQRRVSSSPPPGPTENTAFYVEMAQTEEALAAAGEMDLVACQHCNRRFASDRLEKHGRVCTEATSKRRKVFDSMKMRHGGTDNEKYITRPVVKSRAKKESPKKSNWRDQHKRFLDTVRYAKKVSEVEAQGGNVADLPPPPPSDNPDYVQCQYCQRRFHPGTAQRHIPRCKDIKSRPAPPRNRRR